MWLVWLINVECGMWLWYKKKRVRIFAFVIIDIILHAIFTNRIKSCVRWARRARFCCVAVQFKWPIKQNTMKQKTTENCNGIRNVWSDVLNISMQNVCLSVWVSVYIIFCCCCCCCIQIALWRLFYCKRRRINKGEERIKHVHINLWCFYWV